MSIIGLLTEIATKQGCEVINDGCDLTIRNADPLKLACMFVSTGYEREGLDIGQIVAVTLIDAGLTKEDDNSYTISLMITQTRLMTFDEMRTYQATIGA